LARELTLLRVVLLVFDQLGDVREAHAAGASI
jgi:hypothetical protein